MKIYVAILLTLSLLTTPALASCRQPAAGNETPAPKAAIIDQLSIIEYDSDFVSKAADILETAGFKVDIWRGNDVTVDFYRELPRYEYRLIVFRVHSGILLDVKESQLVPSNTTYLFTGEIYSTKKYVAEQLTDRVSNAMMSDKYPLVFAINSQFITDDLKGSFNDTVIINMGCESFYLDDMANAFIKKGASLFLGWSTVVTLEYVDSATLDLLNNLCLKNMTVGQGVASTMANAGTDPYYDTYLKHYPTESGNHTINAILVAK
jgi:hypothetical protein